MKMSEIRKFTLEDLRKKENDMREEISKLIFQHKIRPLENTSRVAKLRKDVARIHTLRSEMD